MELLLGNHRLLLFFPLAQNRSSFLGELSHRRASLEGLKLVALPPTPRPCPHPDHLSKGEDQIQTCSFCMTSTGLSSLCHSSVVVLQAVTDLGTSAVVPGRHTAPAGTTFKHLQ